jgi:hypothetical protein
MMSPTYVPPLAPLGLAVSLWLNDAKTLLAMLRAIPVQWVTPEDRGLFDAACRAATALAQAAILFEQPGDPLRAVIDPAFVSEARAASAALMEVVAMPWPAMPTEDHRQAEAAYRDFAAGMELLAEGRVPRPDVNNCLTNLTKVIGTIPGHRIAWTFDTLPDWR